MIKSSLLDIINFVDQNYQVCLRYKKNQIETIVVFSLSKDFNNVVWADLKSSNGSPILHMIDHVTGFGVAVVKSRKKRLLTNWIANFGAPGTIISAMREFINDVFHVAVNQFNINVKATPGESPWSIGVVEHHNAVLGKMVSKSILDENNKLHVIVA